MSVMIAGLRGTKKGLLVLLLGMLVSLASAQEYPQKLNGASAAAGRAGSSWFLVVSVVGQSQAATDAKGPMVDVMVEQVIDYTTEVTRQNNVEYPSSFLEKIAESGAETISVGDRLAVQWPLEQLLSVPEVCSKCEGDVDLIFPSDVLDERDVSGFCGVCGNQWEEADEGATPWQRQEHEVACQKDAGLPQKFCCLCGEELIAVRQTCNPPAGKWIVGGRPGGGSGQTKAFTLDGYYVHHNNSAASELLRTLGSWEQENQINTWEQDVDNRWGD